MIVSLKFSLAMFFGFVVLGWLSLAIAREHPKLRNPLAFCVAFGAAYSASFALDLFFGAIAHVYSFSPLEMPVFTWAVIGLGLHLLSRLVAISARAIRVPYLLIGALAVLAGVIGPHRHSVYTGLALLVIGVFAPLCSPYTGMVGTPHLREVMRGSIIMLLTLGVGIGIAFFVAQVVKMWYPKQASIVFLLVSGWWLWTGRKFARARDQRRS